MIGHEGHHVAEFGPDQICNGRQHCFDCGVTFIAVKKPAEYIVLKLEPENRMIPLTTKTGKTNGGVECDMERGPCACGAWH